MSPELLSQLKSWLDLAESGGIVLVLVTLLFMFFRGDLLSKSTVEAMIHKIVEETVAQTINRIKEDIARDIGDRIVNEIRQTTTRRGQW